MSTGMRTALAASLALTFGFTSFATAQQPASGVKTLKMQSSWPASSTLQDNFRMFAERMDKLTGGQIKIDALAAGEVKAAKEAFHDATLADPRNARAHHGLGVAYLMASDTSRGVAAIEKALTISTQPDRTLVINAAAATASKSNSSPPSRM